VNYAAGLSSYEHKGKLDLKEVCNYALVVCWDRSKIPDFASVRI